MVFRTPRNIWTTMAWIYPEILPHYKPETQMESLDFQNPTICIIKHMPRPTI